MWSTVWQVILETKEEEDNPGRRHFNKIVLETDFKSITEILLAGERNEELQNGNLKDWYKTMKTENYNICHIIQVIQMVRLWAVEF